MTKRETFCETARKLTEVLDKLETEGLEQRFVTVRQDVDFKDALWALQDAIMKICESERKTKYC